MHAKKKTTVLAPVMTFFALAVTAPVLQAQSETVLKRVFEGREVRARIDMPGHKAGVDIRPEAKTPLDYSELGERIRRYGPAIRRGDTALVTLVKVKRKNIEFHLGGGGFTGGSSSAYTPTSVPKSNREKRLQQEIDDETDLHRRRELREELEDEREAREREEDRLKLEVELNRRLAEAIELERRAQAGSRFNLWYEPRVPIEALTPEAVMSALSPYLEFLKPEDSAVPVASTPVQGEQDFWEFFPLRTGQTQAEVTDRLGPPNRRSSRSMEALDLEEHVYSLPGAELTLKYVDGILVSYVLASR